MKIRTLFKCLQIFYLAIVLGAAIQLQDRNWLKEWCLHAVGSWFFVEREGGSEGEATRNLSVSKTRDQPKGAKFRFRQKKWPKKAAERLSVISAERPKEQKEPVSAERGLFRQKDSISAETWCYSSIKNGPKWTTFGRNKHLSAETSPFCRNRLISVDFCFRQKILSWNSSLSVSAESLSVDL